MTKEEISKNLFAEYHRFVDFVKELDEEKFLYAPPGKWNAGQQLDHLIRSVSPLSTGLKLPKFIVRLVFGKANRPSKSYQELVNKYKMKLEAGGRAAGRFVPNKIELSDKNDKGEKLLKEISQLTKNINRYSEQELDSFILPHPLLGKITLREMMYFTIYHAGYHLVLVKKYLETV